MTVISDYVVNSDVSIDASAGTASVDLGTDANRLVICVYGFWTQNTSSPINRAPKVDGNAMTYIGGYDGFGTGNMNYTYTRIWKYENPPTGTKTLTGAGNTNDYAANANLFIILKKVRATSPVGTLVTAAASPQTTATASDAVNGGSITIGGLAHANYNSPKGYDILSRGAGQENVLNKNIYRGYILADIKVATATADQQSWTEHYPETNMTFILPIYVLPGGYPNIRYIN
jgi:hypothetical protein